jgi:hypothetical protein
VIGIKKKPDTGQKKTCYTTDNFFGVHRCRENSQIFKKKNLKNPNLMLKKKLETLQF